MKVLFIGSTRRGFQTLKAIHTRGFNLVGIISLPQHSHEHENSEHQIESLAKSHKIPLIRVISLNDVSTYNWIRKIIKPDIGIVVGCRVLIPKEIYNIPKSGMYGAHDSLLPNYRGFAPLNWVLLNAEKKTGVSLFKISEKMDEGDLYGQSILRIKNGDSAPQLFTKICNTTEKLVINFLMECSKNNFHPKKQDDSRATYTCPRIPDDGLIDWNKSSKSIYQLILALKHPYPGAFVFHKMRKVYIESAYIPVNFDNYVGRIPGRIVARNIKNGTVDVLTGDGVIRIESIRISPKKVRPATDRFGSVRESLSVSIPDLIDRIHKLEQTVVKLKS